MLPAAASYPGETYPADQRLRKVSFEDSAGDRYLFWELLVHNQATSCGMDRCS
jgi:hypothetical protein